MKSQNQPPQTGPSNQETQTQTQDPNLTNDQKQGDPNEDNKPTPDDESGTTKIDEGATEGQKKLEDLAINPPDDPMKYKAPPVDTTNLPNVIEEEQAYVKMSKAEFLQFVNEQNERAVSNALREQAKLNVQTAKVEAKEDKKSTWPYGNRDKNKEFDLTKFTVWNRLPDDAIVVVQRAYNRDSQNNKIGTDVKNSQIFVFDPIEYAANQRTSKGSGQTVYGLLGMELEPIHVPEGVNIDAIQGTVL